MKRIDRQSISLKRLLAVFAVLFALVFLLPVFASASVKNRLLEFDRSCTFDGIEFGLDAVIVRNLQMPEIGIFAGNTFVLTGGSIFRPVPIQVVLQGVVVQIDSSNSSRGSAAQRSDLPAVSIVDGFIPLYSTEFSVTRRDGTDMGYAAGDWGAVFINRSRDSISVAFVDCSSIPGIEGAIPPMARGHSISGNCSGVLGPEPRISGRITELDGELASASFEYSLQEGRPFASFSMDFSQVADPAMAFMDSLSSGAVMAAVPAGSLSVSLSGNDSIFFASDLQFDSLSIWSVAVAPDTFFLDAALSCRGFVVPGSTFLVIDTGTVFFNELALDFNLAFSWGERQKLTLVLSGSSLSGEAIAASIPQELLGNLRGLSLGGELSLFTELVLDWDYPDSSDIEIDVDASGLTVGYSPITFGRIRNYTGADCLMCDSWGNRARIGLDTLTNPDFVFFDSLPPSFEPLLRCAEDASFRRHNGFSEYHIRNSIRANMEQGRFVRGGSTITMQLAKNLFLGREKTLSRKMQEVFLTWRLERWLSKNRILEIYANIVELGPGVFGFNSAAMYYFDENAADLSAREVAFLVSILPGPRLYHRYAVQGQLPYHWKSYVNRLLTISGDRGWLDQSIVSDAVADTLIFDGAVSIL
ncbi:MAG: biosynthetic peptidoglycan transglycosylase [Candidatus Fermentibacteria bacterium]|nr:biosynthetic peptidoglycan transglycosylase [Candidatus Fermentibacteria bacterium]